MGAIRWDAWWQNSNQLLGGVPNPSVFSTYSSRQPTYGWYDHTQTAVDSEINAAADNNLDYWAFDWYPQWQTGGYQKFQEPFDYYLRSAYHHRMKFAFLIQTYWVANGDPSDPTSNEAHWRTDDIPYFINNMKDPQYLKVGGRPVVYWYGSSDLDNTKPCSQIGASAPPCGFSGNSTASAKAQIDYFRSKAVAAGVGDPYIIDAQNGYSAAKAYGFQARTSYEPPYSTGPGHACYNTLRSAAKTRNESTPTDLGSVPSVSTGFDARPRSSKLAYYDDATYSEFEGALHDAQAWIDAHRSQTPPTPLMLIYAWNEFDEGGKGLAPNVQDGTTMLQAVRNVRTNTLPASWTDVVNDDRCDAYYYNNNGVAWRQNSGVHGPNGTYHNDTHSTSNSGNSVTFHSTNADYFQVVGDTGPQGGTYDIYIDDVPVATGRSAYSATAKSNVTLYTSPTLRRSGSHKYSVVCRGGGTLVIDAARFHTLR